MAGDELFQEGQLWLLREEVQVGLCVYVSGILGIVGILGWVWWEECQECRVCQINIEIIEVCSINR